MIVSTVDEHRQHDLGLDYFDAVDSILQHADRLDDVGAFLAKLGDALAGNLTAPAHRVGEIA
jgi:hypothetical protein